MIVQKNRFAAAGFDDSDDEVIQHKTKTQVKKEERKITDKKAPKVNPNQMEAGGFEVVSKNPQQQEPRRGGKAAATRGGQHSRGGRGGARPVRLDADGNKVGAGSNNRERRPFAGKPREDAHPMDRRDGTGRGRRPQNKRDGHGKGNVGHSDDVAYKKKDDLNEGEAAKEETKEEQKVEEPKVIVKEETLGISMDDFFANRSTLSKKEGREAEGLKGAKVQANAEEKNKQSTVVQNTYLKGTVAKTSDAKTAEMTGFGTVADEDFGGDNRRGGKRPEGGQRGGKGGQRGGRRQNPKQALKKTEEDFPSL